MVRDEEMGLSQRRAAEPGLRTSGARPRAVLIVVVEAVNSSCRVVMDGRLRVEIAPASTPRTIIIVAVRPEPYSTSTPSLRNHFNVGYISGGHTSSEFPVCGAALLLGRQHHPVTPFDTRAGNSIQGRRDSLTTSLRRLFLSLRVHIARHEYQQHFRAAV